MKNVIMILCSLLLSHVPLSGQETARWTVRQLMILEPNPGAEFGSVAGLAIDRSGALYLSDPISCTLWKFDVSGKFLGRTGRRGDRAGEFRAPSMVAIAGDTIVVMQSTSPALQFFSDQLLPLGWRRPYDGQPVCLAIDRKGRLIVAGMRANADRQNLLILPSLMAAGGNSRALAPGQRTEDFFQACHVATCPDGSMVVAFLFENRIVWIDRNGTAIRNQSLPGLRALSAEEESATVPEETAFKSVVSDARGQVYLLGGSLAPHPHCDVFLLDASGRFLGSVALPHPSRFLAVDAKGDLYGTSNEGTVVRKYRLRRGGGRSPCTRSKTFIKSPMTSKGGPCLSSVHTN
jgi:hypothetical protein